MSDFTAKIVAQLDTSKIPSQLSQIESMISKRKFVMQVDTSATKELNHVKSAYNDLMKLQQRINSTRVKLSGLDANKDKAQISALSGQLNRLMADYNNLYSTCSRKLSTTQLDNLSRGFEVASNKISVLNAKAADTKGVDKLERSFARLKDIVGQMGKIQLKINGLDATKNASEIAQLTAQFKDLESQYTRLSASLKTKMSGIQSSEISNALKNTQNQLAQLDAKAQDTKRRLIDAINIKVSDGSLTSSIAKVTSEYERLATTGHGKLSEIKADIESLNQLQAKLGKSKDVNELIANYNKFNATLNKVKNGLSTVSAESKTFASSLQIAKLDNKIASWMEKNTKAAKTYGKSLDELRMKLAALSNSGSPVPVSSVNAIENEFNAINQAAIASGKTGQTWGSTFKNSFASISKYVSASTLIYAGIRGLKDMYQNVTNIDSAMIELKKVTDETEESYSKFLAGTNKKAQAVGTTITGLVTSTADFARIGYTFEESQKLAETANIYAVVGDEVDSVDTATKSIISTMKAFNINTNDSISIVDKFNEVGNKFAISSGGIGDAMQRSASSMRAANNTIDETIALIAAANTVVQDPDVVGTAFKTMSMRIRGAKTELEEAGLETDGMAESTAKLQEEIKALSGVDIMLDKNTFKSTYQILDELAQKWGGLTDIQQASITELIAGKRQGNIVSSLMENFDEARRALDVSMNSEGSAMKEHEKWLDSVEAKQLQLKASWEGLSQDFLTADFVKGGVDLLRGIVNAIDSIVKAIGSLGTVATGVGLVGLKKFIGTQGLGGLIKVITAIPAPAAIAVAAIAAIGVGVYAVNKAIYNSKYKWGEGMSKGAEEIGKYSAELSKLQKLSKEVKDLKFVINSSNSSKEEVETARNRLQEIADLLNKDYNLNITSNTDDLENTLNLLTQQTRGDMIKSAQDYIAKVEKNSGKYKEGKANYAADEARLAKLSQLNADYQSLQSQYSLIDWFDTDKTAENLKQAEKIYAKWGELHKTAVELGVNDQEKGVVLWEDLQGIPLDEMSKMDYYNVFFAEMNKVKGAFNDANKQLPDIAKSIQEFEESSQKASKYLAQALASDVSVGNTYGADTDVQLIEQLATSLQKAGKSTDGVAKDFAIAKQGFVDFNAAIEAGKLNDVIQEYIRFSEKFKESNESIVRNVALLKQGYTDASQVTAESVGSIYNDMKELGKNRGMKDYVENAIKNTALLSAGFNTVEEATASGVSGVNAVLNKIKEIGSLEDYWKDLSDDEIVNKITDIAHAMDLLPDNYVVSIDAEGNLTGFVKDAQACAEYLKEINKTKVDFDFNTANLENVNNQIKEAEKILNSFRNEDGTVNINADGAVEAQTVLANLLALKQSLSEKPAVMNVDVSKVDGELGAAIQTIQNFQRDMNDFQIKAAIGADTSGIQSAIQNEISTLKGLSPEIKAALGLDTTEYENAVAAIHSAEIDVNAGINLDENSLSIIQSTISGISPEILVKAGVDEKAVVDYNPQDKDAKVVYTCDHTDVDNFNPPNLNRTVTYTVKTKGQVDVDGTAHARGTAYSNGTNKKGRALKSGDWGTKSDGIALGGELGEELVVRDGKFFTIGADSAEFFTYKKDDIIFNAEQTKQIFSKGKITHGTKRGKVFANGTAFATGTEKSEFEKEYDRQQHLLKMEQITPSAYLDWLKGAYKPAYESGQIELEDYNKYQEEFYDKSKDFFKDYINDIQHKIDLFEKSFSKVGYIDTEQIIDNYREIQTSVHAEAERFRSQGLDDNSEYIQDLQKQWWDAEEKIIKSITDACSKINESIENSIELDKKHLKDIVNVYEDGSAEELIGTITSKYSAIQANLHDSAEQLRALGYAENSQEIQDLQKQWWDAEESKNDSLSEIFDRRLELSEDYIERSKILGWDIGDNEIKARERILDWISSDTYRSTKSFEEWQEAYLEELEKYNDAVMSTIDKIYSDYSDVIDEANEELDNQITREKALLDIKSKQYDAVNRLAEAQHNADKAIADSRISKAYLSEREYQLIYNEEDYSRISSVISGLDSDITRITKNFNKQIENAYANGQEYLIENITAEYERQVDLKMKELAIAESELELTKKQTQLNNVLAERNIKQLVEKDGKLQWEWVADTDKVRAATEELADAEYEYQKAKREKNQQLNLNVMQENIDDFTDEQERNNKLVKDLGKSIGDIKKNIDNMKNPIDGLTIDVKTLKEQGVVKFSQAIDSMVSKLGSVAINSASNAKDAISSGSSYGSSSSVSYAKVSYDKNTDYMAKAQSAISKGDYASAAGYIAQRNAKIDGEGLSYAKVSVNDVKKAMGYASGTLSATKGIHRVNEYGEETYITKDGVFHNFSGGEPVFNAEQTKTLYDLASQSSQDYLSSGLLKSGSKLSETPGLLQTMQNYYDSNDTSYGDAHITINNPANFDEFTKRLISEFKKRK